MHKRFDEENDPGDDEGAMFCAIVFLVVVALVVANIVTAFALCEGNKRLSAIEHKIIEREVLPAPAEEPAKPDAEKPPRTDDLGGCEVCGK
jgi:hypothetical protein